MGSKEGRYARAWPPPTVVAYGAIVATVLLVSLAREGAHERLVLGGLLLTLATVGLWRSVWVAWLFLVVVVGAGSLAVLLVRWPSSSVIAFALPLHGTMLALLLSPPTRRHVRRSPPPFTGSSSTTPPDGA
jgi:hypothetical protein